MKVLLLGGKGYIGSRLEPYLSSKGHDVTIYDLCWFGDLTSSSYVYKDFNHIPTSQLETYDAVVLLAGHSSVKMCIDNYQSSFNNNIRNFMRLVNKLENTQVKLIYASSSSIYGNTKDNLAEETLKEFVCVNNYDLTKYVIDQYMLNNNPIDQWYGLRFGTVNGFSRNFRSELMVNSMTKSALETDEIQISNKHINRAILDIEDLCAAVDTILRLGSKETSGVYNINSFNNNVEQIAEQVASLTSAKILDNGNIGNPYDFMISNKKFSNTFNFKFMGSIERIVNNIKIHYNDIVPSTRDKAVYYEQLY